MKWETLKKKCADFFWTYHNQEWGFYALEAIERMKKTGKLNKFREVETELKTKAYNGILSTDIRAIGDLIKWFPSCVPYWIKSGNYSVEYTDSGFELIQNNHI